MGKKLDVIDVNQWSNSNRDELSIEEKRRRRQRQRARQLAIKKRRRQRLIRLAVSGAAIAGLLIMISRIDFADLRGELFGEREIGKLGGAQNAQSDSVRRDWSERFLYEVEYEEFFEENTPQVLSDAEVYQRLKELAEEYPELQEIYGKCDEYPVKLLSSLCNNPELHEYVKDYLAYEAGDTSVVGEAELTEEEKEQEYPLFLQWDKRWGYEEYGDSYIALSGCGPTTLAMAATALTEDDTITPDRVAKYSMVNGYYVEGTGTAWSLMTDGCENFGIKSDEISLDEYVMKNQLDEGKVIICSMGPGYFTSVGHFIMIYDYNENGFWINDANCIYRSSRQWTYEELKSQIRILWAFEKK